MIDLLQLIEIRLEDILGAELFDDPAGGTSGPLVRISELDPKRDNQENDEDFPFVVIRPTKGSADMREEIQQVELIGGIYTDGGVINGFTDIDRLTELLLQVRKNRSFTPYQLALPVQWAYGLDEKTARQPHPYYYTTVTLPFKRQPQATTRR